MFTAASACARQVSARMTRTMRPHLNNDWHSSPWQLIDRYGMWELGQVSAAICSVVLMLGNGRRAVQPWPAMTEASVHVLGRSTVALTPIKKAHPLSSSSVLFKAAYQCIASATRKRRQRDRMQCCRYRANFPMQADGARGFVVVLESKKPRKLFSPGKNSASTSCTVAEGLKQVRQKEFQ